MPWETADLLASSSPACAGPPSFGSCVDEGMGVWVPPAIQTSVACMSLVVNAGTVSWINCVGRVSAHHHHSQ